MMALMTAPERASAQQFRSEVVGIGRRELDGSRGLVVARVEERAQTDVAEIRLCRLVRIFCGDAIQIIERLVVTVDSTETIGQIERFAVVEREQRRVGSIDQLVV